MPPPLCGVLIIGEETIVYSRANAFKAIPIRPVSKFCCCSLIRKIVAVKAFLKLTIFCFFYALPNENLQSITKAYGRVDADGSRYLLGDHAGLLHLLVITHEKEKWVVVMCSLHGMKFYVDCWAVKVAVKICWWSPLLNHFQTHTS